jgi:hypothetical protein
MVHFLHALARGSKCGVSQHPQTQAGSRGPRTWAAPAPAISPGTGSPACLPALCLGPRQASQRRPASKALGHRASCTGGVALAARGQAPSACCPPHLAHGGLPPAGATRVAIARGARRAALPSRAATSPALALLRGFQPALSNRRYARTFSLPNLPCQQAWASDTSPASSSKTERLWVARRRRGAAIHSSSAATAPVACWSPAHGTMSVPLSRQNWQCGYPSVNADEGEGQARRTNARGFGAQSKTQGWRQNHSLRWS